MRFKEFLLMEDPNAPVETDPEDLSSEDLNIRAKELQKLARMKSQGNSQRADAEAEKMLKRQIQTATNPRQKADLQRRFAELKSKKTDIEDNVNL